MIDCPSEQTSQKALNSLNLKSVAYWVNGEQFCGLPAQPGQKLMVDSEHARNRAEAALKRKEDARAEGLKARDEYEAGQRAMPKRPSG